MIVAVIVACEVGFWVLLGLGLVARYVLRWRRTSVALLIAVPTVDLVLLTVTVIDLKSGAPASTAHGLAAVYLGFSVAFGHRAIRWADQRVAHRFAGGPPPVKPPKYGAARVKFYWMDWLRALLGGSVAVALLGLAILVIGDDDRTAALAEWIYEIGVLLAIWLVIGPVRTMLTPRTPPAVKDLTTTSR